MEDHAEPRAERVLGFQSCTYRPLPRYFAFSVFFFTVTYPMLHLTRSRRMH